MYNIIVACDLEDGIGKDNKLPWNFPEDLKRFSQLTRGKGNNAVVMGKNTWESLPKKPLPKRDNLILSTSSISYFLSALVIFISFSILISLS